MEKAISQLTIFNTSKEGIEKYINQCVSEVEAGMIDPLHLLIYLKTMQKICEGIEKKIKDSSLSEANKYPGKSFEFNGAYVSKEELGTKYDYENCQDKIWEMWDAKAKDAATAKKTREAFLKTIKEPFAYTDTETGETWQINPPIKTSTSGIKITIK